MMTLAFDMCHLKCVVFFIKCALLIFDCFEMNVPISLIKRLWYRNLNV